MWFRMKQHEFGEDLNRRIRFKLPPEYNQYKSIIDDTKIPVTLSICKPNHRYQAPKINLTEAYMKYCNGRDIKKLAEEYAEYFVSEMEKKKISLTWDTINKWAAVRDKVYLYAINAAANERLLCICPYRLYGEIALVCKAHLDNGEVMTIGTETLRDYPISEQVLFERAEINSARDYPESVQQVEPGHYKITSQLGASVVFYPGVLHTLSQETSSNLMIYPSSLKAVDVYTESHCIDIRKMNQQLTAAAKQEVNHKNVLVSRLHYYDDDTCSMVVFEGQRSQNREKKTKSEMRKEQVTHSSCSHYSI